ncbi:hypothetical protein [Actinokineospora sp.]
MLGSCPFHPFPFELGALVAAADRAGGEEALVHRMLWDPEFDLPRA